ncbi:L-glutamate gamma-semialdehyde dehydrogenase [Desulfovermiculus halophilus]|jgi:1-pyrroline-5-carboxylate dehydrogenase|uniref:L-glutamate gamma-semialdehyde dehydrogenase n=1 Tax=Desulfovermiculus halophilus TaxID=339722 RepID=UPI00048667DC|nr:L-glutamate gamma-semialdehyde dehydrogenase [Desulfovermiculus halophilus]
MNWRAAVPTAVNEPVHQYAPGTEEKARLKAKLKELSSQELEIPVIIGGKEIYTGQTAKSVMPHNHSHVLATYHMAGENEIRSAIDAAMEARKEWSRTPWETRVAVMKKAAYLISTRYRERMNAAAMLGIGKNCYQAEIEAVCELCDFLNFNSQFLYQLYAEQPPYSPYGTWNCLEHRPLEGFVFAATPFNFVAIAGNLPTSPALMGNVVLWKPASSAVYPAYHLMQILQEAGLPDGVINFIPGKGSVVGPKVMADPNLAGVHFTGSTPAFQDMWRTIGTNIQNYRSYPRIVGETGGKDFIVLHESADVDAAVAATVRGAFEYQGQKCSAASRAYIPKSLYQEFKDKLIAEVKNIKMGDVQDFTNFVNAVIDKAAFDKIKGYLDYAKESSQATILVGGEADDSVGYFIQPTVIETEDPRFKTMEEEIFGPVVTLYAYEDGTYEQALHLCDETSPYALTGAVFARDRKAIAQASDILSQAAGNFYINDKPTGSIVGQQPFGGSRASGTNDKAGSIFNLMRWVSQRAIKENFDPPKDYRYPFMGEE